VFVDELRLPVAAEQYGEVIEPGDDPLELYSLHKEHGDRRFRSPKIVQEHVLKVVDLIGHCRLSLLAKRGQSAAISLS
jgi:hypothetical protein